jgi:hypothetical protein
VSEHGSAFPDDAPSRTQMHLARAGPIIAAAAVGDRPESASR